MILKKKYRQSLRLQNYDYSRHNAYFVTVCTQHRACVLGQVLENQVLLSNYGQIINKQWLWLSTQYPYVVLDEFVVMPNHFHGILSLHDHEKKQKSLSQLIGALKTTSARAINLIRQTPGQPFWQRSFYERIIRNEKEFEKIQEYIVNNPLKWSFDDENPACQKNPVGRSRPATTFD